MKNKILSTLLVFNILLMQSMSLHHKFFEEHQHSTEQNCQLCQLYSDFSSTCVSDNISFDLDKASYSYDGKSYEEVLFFSFINSYNSQAPPIS